MTNNEVLEQLSMNEKKVLLALGKKDKQSPEDIIRSGGFSQLVEVMNASSWLQTKGLVSMSEASQLFYFLAKKQVAAKGLPERRILAELSKEEGMMFVRDIPKKTKMDEGEVSPAVGWLKKKGWADIKKDGKEPYVEMTPKGEEMLKKKGRDEDLIEKLAEGEMNSRDADADLIKQLKTRQGIIGEREVVSRIITLTEKGQEIVKLGIKFKPQAVQVTSELLQSGKWRDVEFRRYDITAFAPSIHGGKPHPLTKIIDEIAQIFLEMGFTQIHGDYVQSAFWNMDALFIPQDHPARELQDTIYLSNPKEIDITKTQPDPDFYKKVKAMHETGGDCGSKGWRYEWSRPVAQQALLRTHTTVNTIRALYDNPNPPLKVFSIEHVFRNEAIDFKHLPEFQQIEGIVHEEGASFAQLKGLLKEFYSRMGFKEIRLRPAYFPYTEPSMEVEVKFKGKWMEMGGSGIFRREVTAPVGVKHPVLAWGLGLERLAMNVLGLDDIRDLYVSDIKWLNESPTFFKK